jgi:thiamine-monophosphate kinase
MPGEDRFVRRLLAEIPKSPRLLIGPGDDAAVVAGSAGPRAVTTDTLVEGVDFLPSLAPEALGRRAMAVNLSDLAAMGASPELFLLTVGFPPGRGEDFPLRVVRGALSRAVPLGAALAGGDLSSAPSVFVSIAIWGTLAGEPLRRSGASAGDVLFLSGATGRAAAGLRLASDGEPARGGAARLSDADRAELLSAYLDPEPRLDLGIALAREGLATAAIDVSDGLGIDAARLAEASGLRAVIEADRVPIAASLAAFARGERSDPLDAALAGGDDYELLFAVAPDRAGRISSGEFGPVAVTRVGRMEEGRGAVVRSAAGDRDAGALGHDLFGAAK